MTKLTGIALMAAAAFAVTPAFAGDKILADEKNGEIVFTRASAHTEAA